MSLSQLISSSKHHVRPFVKPKKDGVFETLVQDQLLQDIKSEQSRIRSNMSALDHDSDIYHRYVQKLTAQEDRFDAALQLIARLRGQRTDQQRELAKFFPSS